jgi:hypothetical protein
MISSASQKKRVTLPKPMDHQIPCLRHPARMKVMVCGRRWGKTALGLIATLAGHGEYKGQRIGAIQGGKIWWVAPDYPTASEIWRDIKNACRDGWTAKHEQERRIEFSSGGAVTVRSAHDPSTLVAVGLDGLVMDEAGKTAPEAWQESLRPTLADRQGWAIFIGTPKGYNWFHQLYQHAGTAHDWARWQRPTWDNPLVPPSEIEAAKRDSPKFFGQEFGARFESLEGAEWPPEYFPDSIWFHEWPRDMVATGLALDPAQGKGEREKGCYAAFVLAGIDPRGVIWLECWASKDWDAKALAERMAMINRERVPTACSTELNGGQGFLVDTLKAASRAINVNLPLYGFTNSVDKEVRIRTLGPLFAQSRVRIRDTPGGKIMMTQLRDFPMGEFVDCCDAAEMACRLLVHIRRKGGPAPVGNVPVLLR